MIALLAATLVVAPTVEPARAIVRTMVHSSLSPAMDARQAALFDASLNAELRKRLGIELVHRQTADATAGLQTGKCPEDPTSCLAKLAMGLGVDEILLVGATTLEGRRVLSLKRIWVQTADVSEAVVKQIIGGSGEEFLLVLGDAIAELYPRRPLHDGARAGVPAAIVDRWSPPPIPRWGFWSSVALTTAAATGLVTAALLQRQARADFDELAARGVAGETIEGAALVAVMDRVDSRTTLTNAMIGVTTGLLALATVSWFITDWGSDNAAVRGLLPFVTPHGGGASITLRW